MRVGVGTGPRVAMRTGFVVPVGAIVSLCALHLLVMIAGAGGPRATIWVGDLVRLGATLTAAACCLGTAVRGSGRSRRAWALMAVAASAWGAGELVRCWDELVVGEAVPFPSLRDADFLVAVPAAVAAVLTFAGHTRVVWRLRSIIDGLIIGTALLSVSWATALGAIYHAGGPSRPAAVLALALAHPMGDVVIATMLLILSGRAPRTDRLPLLLLTAGLGAAALADTLFALRTATGAQGGGAGDTVWVVGFLLVSLGAIRARTRSVAPVAASPPPSLNRTLIPYLPVGAATVMAVQQELHWGTPSRFLFATVVLLVLLVITRQTLTLRDNAELLRRIGAKDLELEHQAQHDTLTGLVNRSRLRGLVAETLQRRQVEVGPPPAILVLDIDDFTMVNDRRGAPAGDGLLVAVADRLRRSVRPTDAVARIGGDEFAVLIPQVRGGDQLIDVAERILEALTPPVCVAGGDIHATVSLGMAVADQVEVTSDELLRRADVAVRAAKAGGHGLVGVFEPSQRVVLERAQGARPQAGSRSAGASSPADRDGVRLWLARELHDDALQTLTTMLIDMEEARRELPETAIGQRVLGFQTSVRSVITGLRRLLGDLREQPGEDRLLVQDVTSLLDQLEGRAGVTGHLTVSPAWPSSLSTHISAQIRRIVEEALRNVALHSGAQSVQVSLEAEEERLTLTVSDDGRGCQPSDAPRYTGSCGLLGMQERALILGGHLEVSNRPEGGTTVRGTFATRSA